MSQPAFVKTTRNKGVETKVASSEYIHFILLTDLEISSSILWLCETERETYSLLDGDKELREAQFIIWSPMLPITIYYYTLSIFFLVHLEQFFCAI